MVMDILKDLTDYCYQQWLSEERTDLPSGAINWIRDDLSEPGLADQIEKIFSAAIKPSEKCYRFLRLTGVIYREQLIQLLRKQILKELEQERIWRLREIDSDIRARIAEQRQRTFNKPTETSYHFILFALFVAVVCGGVGALITGGFGWAIGLLVGTAIAYGYRAVRSGTAAEQYGSAIGNETEGKKRAIEQSFQDEVRNIDADIPTIEKKYSVPLRERMGKEDQYHGQNIQPSVTGNSHKASYAGLVVMLSFLIVIPPLIFGGAFYKLALDAPGTKAKTDLEILYEAVESGNSVKVESILNDHPEYKNGDPGRFLNTLLHRAAIKGDIGIAKLLITKGANVNELSDDG